MAKAFDREKLLREIASDDRKRRRAAIAALRAEVRAKRERRAAAMAIAAAQCREGRDRARSAREAARAAKERASSARADARSACALPAQYPELQRDVRAARERLREEEEAAREIRAIELAESARIRGAKRPAARERRAESDDEVRANIPAEFSGLFERVKRQIKGGERKSRTEAFLEYVEEHPGEVYEGIDDETDRMIAEHERALRANPGKGAMLIELGRLTKLSYRDEAGRRRVLTWGLRSAPILAYEPKKRASLVIVYAAVPRGRASAAATREYSRVHWGKEGAGAQVAGDVALDPLTDLGPGISIVYTTQKGGDAAASDYDHEWGEGASGKFTPPRVLVHRCRAPRCATNERVALRGGTYLVTDRGIVG